jgi:site-specific DNA-methyltransferase (adenine-specific)
MASKVVHNQEGIMPSDQLTFTPTGQLFFGDNLEVLRRHLPDESVDLVYLDPPFNSNRSYNVIFQQRDGRKAAGQLKAFDDTWVWSMESARVYQEVVEAGGDVSRALRAFRDLLGTNDMLAYLTMMAPRLAELRRIVKSSGSLVLHCDPTASHYLKMLLDATFGPKNFRNEIAWCYTGPGNVKKWFPRKHDILLFYVKDARHSRFFPDAVRVPYAKSLEAARARTGIFKDRDADDLDDYIERADRSGKIVEDWWADITPVGRIRDELEGYPTQKPLALLQRIILATTETNDTVLDPFCGCGTAVDAAQALGRSWIGIDITKVAIDVVRRRLARKYQQVDYQLRGEPTTLDDAEALAELDKFEFQRWACQRIGINATTRKGADRGIDGELVGVFENGDSWRGIVSVKGGAVNVTQLRDLSGTVSREGADFGVLVSLKKPTGPMKREAADSGFTPEGVPRLQLLTIEEVFASAMPTLPSASSRPTTADKRAARQLRAV